MTTQTRRGAADLIDAVLALGAPDAHAAARQYCRTSGGQPHVATPYFNTNDPQRAWWLKLADTTELCRFENGKPGAMTSTRVYVDLDTLYSTTPTFAGVAYLAKIAPPKDTPPSANPASAHCSALFGASQFGWSDNGGGWVTDDRPNEVFNLCVFADQSFVDEFALWYYTQGIVRGRDLAKVMRYRPAHLPNFFPH